MLDQIVRGPLLIPREDESIVYYPNGVLASDADGIIQFVGDYRGDEKGPHPLFSGAKERRSDGVMMPPLLDIHTHIPQHPIRGRFVEGVPEDAPGDRKSVV